MKSVTKILYVSWVLIQLCEAIIVALNFMKKLAKIIIQHYGAALRKLVALCGGDLWGDAVAHLYYHHTLFLNNLFGILN